MVKDGRFGEYVTDGEYNATLRKDDTVETITLERAAELLAERRERGPAKKAAKKGAKKAPAKKAAAKKAPAKKTAAKKTAAKKTAAKKTDREDDAEGRGQEGLTPDAVRRPRPGPLAAAVVRRVVASCLASGGVGVGCAVAGTLALGCGPYWSVGPGVGARPHEDQDRADERDEPDQDEPAALVDVVQASHRHGQVGQEQGQRGQGVDERRRC